MGEEEKTKSSAQLRKLKNIENLMNDGYEWNADKKSAVRNTETKLSIKFAKTTIWILF